MARILTEDLKEMADEVKKLGEAKSAMSGVLMAASNGSDAYDVRKILIDSVQVADSAVRRIEELARAQPRQQDLPDVDTVTLSHKGKSVTTSAKDFERAADRVGG